MAGVSFDILFGVVLYLMSVWGCGRLFRKCTLPAILGEILAGIVLGPELLDVVPFASDGTCIRLIDEAASSSGSSSESGRMLADVEVPSPGPSPSPSPSLSPSLSLGLIPSLVPKPTQACKASLVWSPRWGDEMLFTNDIWSFAGTVGMTLLIMDNPNPNPNPNHAAHHG